MNDDNTPYPKCADCRYCHMSFVDRIVGRGANYARCSHPMVNSFPRQNEDRYHLGLEPSEGPRRSDFALCMLARRRFTDSDREKHKCLPEARYFDAGNGKSAP